MTLSSSPLHEAVALWRHSQQGTVEDFAELDRILARYRRPDTVIAHVLARVAEPDVPLHVAADIDQIVWEQDSFDVRREFALATDHPEGYVPADSPAYTTAQDARDALAPWMHAHVVSRIVVESRVSEDEAH